MFKRIVAISTCIAIAIQLLSSCAGAAGAVVSGGAASTAGSTAAGAAGASALGGPLAIILAAVSAPSVYAYMQARQKKYIPIIYVAGDNERYPFDTETHSYIVLRKGSEKIALERNASFCRNLFNRILMSPNSGTSYFVGKERAGQMPAPIIWPLRVTGGLSGRSCSDLVTLYDYEAGLRINAQLPYRSGNGPIFVATAQSSRTSFIDLRKSTSIYWDLSSFDASDFDRSVELWQFLMSLDHNEWKEAINRIAAREELRNWLLKYGGERAFPRISEVSN